MKFILTDSSGNSETLEASDVYAAAAKVSDIRGCKTARAMVDDRNESAIVILKSGECFRIERETSRD